MKVREVPGASGRFIDARVLVRLPMGNREAMMVPQSARIARSGLYFVQVETASGRRMRAVVPGERTEIDGQSMVEVLSGLVRADHAPLGWGMGGDLSQFRDMDAAFGVALLSIYILVVAQSGSFKRPPVTLRPSR